jgi:chromosome segregation ATPase
MDAIGVAAKAFKNKTEQDLIDEIQSLQQENKTYKEQIKILTTLIESCKNCQLQAQIEVLPKQ